MTEQSYCSNKNRISIDNYAHNFYTRITTQPNAEMIMEDGKREIERLRGLAGTEKW